MIGFVTFLIIFPWVVVLDQVFSMSFWLFRCGLLWLIPAGGLEGTSVCGISCIRFLTRRIDALSRGDQADPRFFAEKPSRYQADQETLNFKHHPDRCYPLVMPNSLLLKIAIYSEFSHEKWWFSIAMGQFTRGYIPR